MRMMRDRGSSASGVQNIADDIVACMWTIATRVVNQSPKAVGGSIVPGSWNAQEGTVGFQIGRDASTNDDLSFREPQVAEQLPLAHHGVGMQEGPRGGERAYKVPHGGGWIVHLVTDKPYQGVPNYANSIGAPAGEFWIAKRDANGNVTAYIKMTNDGKAAGDLKTGFRALVGAFTTFVSTSGMISWVWDDSIPSATLSVGPVSFALNGNTPSMMLSVGNFVVLIANGTMQIGKTGLSSVNALMTAEDTDKAIAAAITALAMVVQPGGGVPVPPYMKSSGSPDAESSDS